MNAVTSLIGAHTLIRVASEVVAFSRSSGSYLNGKGLQVNARSYAGIRVYFSGNTRLHPLSLPDTIYDFI